MSAGRPLSPTPPLRVVTPEGRYLIGFFGGAPDWSAHEHHARRFYCPIQADAAQRQARAAGFPCAVLVACK